LADHFEQAGDERAFKYLLQAGRAAVKSYAMEYQSTRERRNQLKHTNYEKPELLATGLDEVWSRDISKLKGPEKWTYYYLALGAAAARLAGGGEIA